MLGIFSTGRSLAGIYRELRALRQLAEAYFTHTGIPLPQTPYQRLKDRLTAPVLGRSQNQDRDRDQSDQSPLTEEELAQKEVERIITDLSEGRDPGTDYRPWLR